MPPPVDASDTGRPPHHAARTLEAAPADPPREDSLAARSRALGRPTPKFYTTFRNTIYLTMRERGWIELSSESDDWDFIWAGVDWIIETFDTRSVGSERFVNHFRSFAKLCRKDLMARHIKDARKAMVKAQLPGLAQQFDCVPQNFNLPTEFPMISEYARKHANCIFIVKPSGKAQGRGIFMAKYRELSSWYKETFEKPVNPAIDPRTASAADVERPSYVVQRYVENPLLICGHKFDMRIYVLVESFVPLTCWVCREGFGRFSLQPFQSAKEAIDNPEVHLTNVAIQKHSSLYNSGADGAKWSVYEIASHIELMRGREEVDKLFLATELMIVRSLQAVANEMTTNPCSFEIYGYDIMIDADLRPWLIEVNASPSLSADTIEDSIVKRRMLHDAISILGVDVPKPARTCLHYGCWDKLYDGVVPKLNTAPALKEKFGVELNKGLIHRHSPCLGRRPDRAYSLLQEWRGIVEAAG